MVPSTAFNGITAFIFPPLRKPNSTKRNTPEIIKQMLQMNTILEKKRKSGVVNYY